MDWRMRYPGGKFRCYQKLISLMPAHRVYIETHLGGGAVLRNKAPAEENIGIDLDERVIANFSDFPANYRFLVADSVAWMMQSDWKGDELVYCDPPYLPATRRVSRYYRHDYTDEDHVRLLAVLKQLPCSVMLSAYPSHLYEQELDGWHLTSFGGTSHAGARTECVWTNFKPGLLHDTRYLGWTFRGRQSWRRKQDRWVRRFSALPVAEQQAMLLSLQASFTDSIPQSPSYLNENHSL